MSITIKNAFLFLESHFNEKLIWKYPPTPSLEVNRAVLSFLHIPIFSIHNSGDEFILKEPPTPLLRGVGGVFIKKKPDKSGFLLFT